MDSVVLEFGHLFVQNLMFSFVLRCAWLSCIVFETISLKITQESCFVLYHSTEVYRVFWALGQFLGNKKVFLLLEFGTGRSDITQNSSTPQTSANMLKTAPGMNSYFTLLFAGAACNDKLFWDMFQTWFLVVKAAYL